MKEIDTILIELHHLMTELKGCGGTDELTAKTVAELRTKIRQLFARANPLIKEIDDPDEMERVHKNAAGVAGMASYLFIEKGPEVREFLGLLGINEIKN